MVTAGRAWMAKKEEVKTGEGEVCSGRRGGCMQWWAFVCCLTWKWSDHRPLHPLANWACTCTKYPIAEPALKRVPGSQLFPFSSCRSALMLVIDNNRSGHNYVLPFHDSWVWTTHAIWLPGSRVKTQRQSHPSLAFHSLHLRQLLDPATQTEILEGGDAPLEVSPPKLSHAPHTRRAHREA